MSTATNPYIWGTGRRKTAVARVRIREGTGVYVVNDLPVDDYFVEETHRIGVRAPLTVTDMGNRVDVFVNVRGSGKSAQMGAVILGLSRALIEQREDLEPALRDHDFLTRDSRMVERKKYGHKKARKSFQFSKR
ncbi:MAG: 30S ribosomal protein S9 [Isosphaeraceae bacterium]|nr:30S ribosomal protein S9 [Isosphaeraceae bacterium]